MTLFFIISGLFIFTLIVKIVNDNVREIDLSRRVRNQIVIKRNSTLNDKNNVSNKNDKIVVSNLSNYQQRVINERKQNLINELNSKLSLSDLLITRSIFIINYSSLLNCFEWKYKRLKILLRDLGYCQNCQKYSLSNHVHHKYYITPVQDVLN